MAVEANGEWERRMALLLPGSVSEIRLLRLDFLSMISLSIQIVGSTEKIELSGSSSLVGSHKNSSLVGVWSLVGSTKTLSLVGLIGV